MPQVVSHSGADVPDVIDRNDSLEAHPHSSDAIASTIDEARARVAATHITVQLELERIEHADKVGYGD